MNEVRVRGPHYPIAAFGQAQAKIDVVERNAQVFLIEPAQFFENSFADRHAGASHGRAILLEPGAIEISRMPARNMRERVPGHSAETKNNSAVLQGPVRIPEPRPDGADFFPGGMTDHFREPARIVDFGVVIQQDQDVSPRLSRCVIVEAAVVKWTGVD